MDMKRAGMERWGESHEEVAGLEEVGGGICVCYSGSISWLVKLHKLRVRWL